MHTLKTLSKILIEGIVISLLLICLKTTTNYVYGAIGDVGDEPIYTHLFKKILSNDTLDFLNDGQAAKSNQSQTVLCGSSYVNAKNCKVKHAIHADNVPGMGPRTLSFRNCRWTELAGYPNDQNRTCSIYGNNYLQVGKDIWKKVSLPPMYEKIYGGQKIYCCQVYL